MVLASHRRRRAHRTGGGDVPAGRQAKVPLLAGWNADESRGGVLLAAERPTATSFVNQTRKRFGPAPMHS